MSLLLALVFAIAATPGSMAMPQPKAVDLAMTAMANCPEMGFSSSSCDHAKPQKEQGNPCKNMAACLGMLSCYGMGAVNVAQLATLPAFAEPIVAISHQAVTGLTLRPDNPPPIV